MKKILIILFAFISFGLSHRTEAQISAGISFNTFHDELSPYGRWINYPEYGQVWVANQQGFEPYSDNGHWVFTSYGWTWVSDYPWGWAPFHYGRWAFTSYGWVWVPGYEWAPAWVGWCQNDGYYGWAPLSPGLGFNISFNAIPRNRWRFVQQQYITSPAIRTHYIRPERNVNVYKNVTIINNTQVVNNTTYAAGPNRQEVERVTKQKIEPRQVSFNQASQKTQVEKTQVKIYRPEGKQNQMAVKLSPGVKEEKTTAGKNMPALAAETGKPADVDQQKERASATARNNEEKIKQLKEEEHPSITGAKEKQQSDEKQLPAIEESADRRNAAKEQNIQEQQNIRDQKLQEEKNQQQADQQQDITRKEDLKSQQVQQEKNQKEENDQQNKLKQQQIKQQQQMSRQENNNNLRQQRMQQQEKQQQMQGQRNQQRAVQQQRMQQQNELRQQRAESQQRIQRQVPSQQAPPQKRKE